MSSRELCACFSSYRQAGSLKGEKLDNSDKFRCMELMDLVRVIQDGDGRFPDSHFLEKLRIFDT